MFHDFRPSDLRYIGSGVVAIGFAAGVAWLALQGPWSPGAMARADGMLAQGQADQAIEAYLEIVEAPGSEARHADALWRAAQVAYTDNRLEQAGVLLERFVAEHPQHEDLALAHEARAELFSGPLQRPEDAARAWSEAARSSVDLDDAGVRWLKAGRAWQEAQLLRRARTAYRSATASPASEARAWLALAHMELADDPAKAYDSYDRALLSNAQGDVADVALLGLATAIERMDGAEAALAEVELVVEGEDDALSRRRARLEDDLSD